MKSKSQSSQCYWSTFVLQGHVFGVFVVQYHFFFFLKQFKAIWYSPCLVKSFEIYEWEVLNKTDKSEYRDILRQHGNEVGE